MSSLMICCKPMKALLLPLFLALPVSAHAEVSQVIELSAETWARPHTGASLATMPALQQVVMALDAAGANRLRVRYPGGEEGSLWASELQAWLVALGVSGQRIELVPGGVSAAGLRLEIIEDQAPMVEVQP